MNELENKKAEDIERGDLDVPEEQFSTKITNWDVWHLEAHSAEPGPSQICGLKIMVRWLVYVQYIAEY